MVRQAGMVRPDPEATRRYTALLQLYLDTYHSLAPLLHRTTLRPDVVVLHTSLPRDGTVSLGIEVNVLPAAIEAAL